MGEFVSTCFNNKRTRIISGLSIISVLVSVFVLFGWALDISALKSVLSGLATMKVNTALCFILSGTSLFLLVYQSGVSSDPYFRYVSFSLATIVSMIGLATLFEYLLNIELGIDNLLFKDTSSLSDQYPGRMSLGTAFNFIVLGISISLLSFEKKIAILFSQITSLLLIVLSLIALISYVYSYEALYAFPFYATMALHTSLLFILLGLGTLFVHFNEGIAEVISSEYIGGTIARYLLLLAMSLPFFFGWVLIQQIESQIFAPAFGISVFSILNIVISSIIIWITSYWLNRTDMAKTRTMERQQLLNKELKQSEEGISRLNRVYAVLSGINNAIVRIRDRQKLFDEACRMAVESGQFRMAWIGMLSPEKDELVIQAKAGHVAGYFQHLVLPTTPDDKMLSDSTSILRSQHPLILNNLNQTNLSWKNEALSRGYHSVAVFPLIVSGEFIGIMSFYAQEVGFFDKNEVKLLQELASDISFAIEFIENEKQLNYLAYHDPVTGLANRVFLYQCLGKTIAIREKEKYPFALVLININDFRNINDTLGHNNGDEIIKQVAQRLRSAIWETDTVACLGGDDFAILLPRLVDKDHIDLVIKKIQSAFHQSFNILDIPVNVELTLGVALYPDDGDNVDLLLQNADIALRNAKNLYKPLLYYDSQFDHYEPQQLALIGQLRNAIDTNELVLHYQPRIDLNTEKTVGVEALVRWDHPEKGLLYPDKFIPAVENTGLIDPLTIWVLANALRQVYQWRKAGFPLNLSVNLSVRNLQNPDLKNEILDLIRSSQFPLNHLIMEITESAIMVDPVQAKEVLTELKEAGMIFSVDDFGIGQTSMNYLKELPIAQMKVDKSFVMDMEAPGNLAIVHSAIELGHNLGLSVTAEGIEDERAYKTLRKLKCNLGQGYYFSKPLPPDKFLNWLKVSQWK